MSTSPLKALRVSLQMADRGEGKGGEGGSLGRSLTGWARRRRRRLPTSLISPEPVKCGPFILETTSLRTVTPPQPRAAEEDDEAEETMVEDEAEETMVEEEEEEEDESAYPPPLASGDFLTSLDGDHPNLTLALPLPRDSMEEEEGGERPLLFTGARPTRRPSLLRRILQPPTSLATSSSSSSGEDLLSPRQETRVAIARVARSLGRATSLRRLPSLSGRQPDRPITLPSHSDEEGDVDGTNPSTPHSPASPEGEDEEGGGGAWRSWASRRRVRRREAEEARELATRLEAQRAERIRREILHHRVRRASHRKLADRPRPLRELLLVHLALVRSHEEGGDLDETLSVPLPRDAPSPPISRRPRFAPHPRSPPRPAAGPALLPHGPRRPVWGPGPTPLPSPTRESALVVGMGDEEDEVPLHQLFRLSSSVLSLPTSPPPASSHGEVEERVRSLQEDLEAMCSF